MATRPTVTPEFATDANFPAGSDPWSAQPTKVNPGGVKTGGFVPQDNLAAEYLNFMYGNHGDWLNYVALGNHLFDYREDMEDFDAGPDAVIQGTNGNLIYPGSRTKYVEVSGNGDIQLLNDSSDTAPGWGKIRTSDGNAVDLQLAGSFWLGTSTADYWSVAQLRVPDKTKLETNANNGLRVGCMVNGSSMAVGFRAGSSLAYWEVIKPDGTIQAPTTQVNVATGTTWQSLLVKRFGGTVTWYVDGTQIYTMSDSSALIVRKIIELKGIGGVGAPFDYCDVDSHHLKYYRPIY